MNSNLAIVVSAGTLKGVYGQGVLSVLEERGVKPATWGCASSSAGEAYVDASYTCSCPVYEVAALGFKRILVVDVEMGPTYTSLSRKKMIEPGTMGNAEMVTIRLAVDLKTFGVDYLRASEEGVIKAYQMGYDDGFAAIEQNKELSVTDH